MKWIMILPAALLSAVSHRNAPAPREVEIVGMDYAFRAPSSLKAGAVTLKFRNDGRKSHEFNVFLLKPGVKIDEVVKARNEGKSQAAMIEGAVGVLFAEPGSRAPSGLTTNLLPGRDYGVICIFRDSTGAPRHTEMGMYSVIHVTGKAARTTVPVDSVIGVDYAFSKYPREISPGRHTIAFRNGGRQRHEINVILLNKGVTVDSVLAVEKRNGDIDSLFENNGGMGVLHAVADRSALGGLSIDFLPGREYLIFCSFTDDDKSPPHYKMGMFGSIRVRGTS